MPESMYHQIHFAWAEPTLLGRVGPGPASSSLPESEQPVLRSWRDRLAPALTADYRSALPDTDPADYPETLWAHTYPDGQAALVYRWPGDVRSAHAWAIVGPGYGLTLPRILALHENPNTRPAQRRPPAPGWAAMDTLPAPEPWERTAAPGAVRTRDRHAAETAVGGEPLLVGAVAAALARPDLPVHIALAPERADLWQAVQLRFLWGMHRALHDVLTPPRAIPAAGWSWSFSTYDPVLGAADGRHLAFGPPAAPAATPFLNPPPPDHRRTAEALVAVLREEGGDALAAHLAERGIPEAPTFADRRDLLSDWLNPAPRPSRAVPGEAPPAAPAPLPPSDEGAGGSVAPEPAEGFEAHGAPEPAPPRGFGGRAPVFPAETHAPGYGVPDDDLGLEDVPEAEALPDGEPEPGSGDGLPKAPDADADGGSDGDRGSVRDRYLGGDRAPHGGGDSAGDRAPVGGRRFGGASEQDDTPLPDLPEAEAPGEEETGPRPPSEPWAPAERTGAARPAPGARLGQGSLRAFAEEIARAADTEREAGRARSAAGPGHDTDGNPPTGRSNEALWPSSDPEPAPLPETPEPGPDGAADAPPRTRMPRLAPAHGEPSDAAALRQGEADGDEPQGGHRRTTGIFDAPEPYAQPGPAPARDPLAPPAYYEAGEIVTDDPTPVAGRPRMFGRTLRRAVDRDARAAQRRAAEHREAEEAAPAPGAGEAAEAPEAPGPPEFRGSHERTAPVPPADRRALPADGPPEDFAPPAPPEPVAAPELRAPADAPPLGVVAAADGENGDRGGDEPLDYAAETEPGSDDPFDEGPADDNWPTQYADLPLARLERWHSRRGPEGARVDVVDARAAVRAERAELQRVREERDHYHAEVQDLRRDVARLDRPWLDPEDEEGYDAPPAPRPRRRLPRVLAPILLVAFLAVGLEAGARLDLGALDLLALLGGGIASLFG
ncbi:hypothetical protein ACIRPH_12010 [Nocardiopsis sp. NPDC101807]|uniref:hypothetical protein n=1 Tax=Nocardiopsis sp. NPDC101807 TaxID=3364339 RepID=UPI0037F422BA